MRDWKLPAPEAACDLGSEELLRELLDSHELTDEERDAFSDMRAALFSGERRCLSKKQYAWAALVHERIHPRYENLVSSGLVKAETKVPTLDILKRENLPMKPPRRSQG